MSRQNQWFVPGDGIAREVITADIQRYLGPDALVRPGTGTGEYEGRPGYWITAYRTLTSQMIQDLRMDSTRWQQEQGRQEAGRGVAYQDSRTHAARQHWGPSETYGGQGTGQRREQEQTRAPAHSSAYVAPEQHYTTAASAYTYSNPAAQPASAYTQPRTDLYNSAYAQPAREQHPAYSTQAYSQYAVSNQPDPYRQQPPPPTHAYSNQPSQTAAPGFYIASDGRQYPLSQQPQQPQQTRGQRRAG